MVHLVFKVQEHINHSPPRTYCLGTAALEGPLRAYSLGTWELGQYLLSLYCAFAYLVIVQKRHMPMPIALVGWAAPKAGITQP